MVSPRYLRKLSPLLAISLGFLGFLGATQAQTTTDDLEVTTTSDSYESGTSISSITSSAISSSFLSVSTDSAGSVSTIYTAISSSDNDTETETETTTSKPRLILTGSTKETSTTVAHSVNGTITSSVSTVSTTESAPEPTNTQPCNGHAEFCNRKYSNLTQIAAHNSPFVKPNNAAANQDFDTITQLNDGVRMLQIQAHYINETMWLCHSDCQVLNVGKLEDWLRTVAVWVYDHPYEVVTLLIGNAVYANATDFVQPLEDSGIKQFAYIPPKDPMGRSDWPTLGQMILLNQRVVIFMDYEARQSEVPYVLDEFIHIWETPFDPTSRDFPCVIDRPPDLSPEEAEPRMYMANHNLNTELTLLGNSLLVPTRPLLEETNAVNGTGSLGKAAEDCYEKWGRPPNWLLVDYYDVGNGSVFEVAAKWNNVTYDSECCGIPVNGGGRMGVSLVSVVVALMAALVLV